MKRQGFVDRLKNLAAAEAMWVAVCGLVLAGAAQAASDGAFKTPTGNIVCDLGNTDVVCVIESGLVPPPNKTACNVGDPVANRVDLTATGAAAPVLCAGDPGPLADAANAKILAYGSTMINGTIGCSSFEFGLVCVNSNGRGFFLSRASARYF